MTSHLWILSNLIFPETGPQDDTLNILLKYAITTCHSKMNRRFHHHLSQRHFESLRKVEDFPFNSELQLDTDPTKMRNDRALITGFVSRTLQEPQMLASSIPNIQLFCNNLPHESEPFQLYTSETCTEFHNLVVELLNNFQSSLKKLDDENVKHQSDTFNHHVLRTLVFGHVLLKIARGSAFEMHLQNIVTLLEDHRSVTVTEISMPTDVENEDEELGEVLDEVVNEELLPVLSYVTDLGQPMPLWMTYRDWMRLMVVHFDAAKILINYATDRKTLTTKTLSVKILVTPRVDHAFLPWSDLLTDSRLFPVADASGNKHISNDEILKFLNDGLASVIAANTNEKLGHAIMDLWKVPAKGYKQTVKNLRLLEKLPDYTESVKELLALLSKWNDDRDKNMSLVKEISDKIRSLNGTLTADKDSVPFPADLELKEFSGTLHCETCLASILHKDTRDTMIAAEYQDLLKQTEVDYHYSYLSML